MNESSQEAISSSNSALNQLWIDRYSLEELQGHCFFILLEPKSYTMLANSHYDRLEARLSSLIFGKLVSMLEE